MSKASVIWCAHPLHEEVLSSGKKRYWKTGSRPNYPKGKRSVGEELADFINSHNAAIINRVSEKLGSDDYLCTTCFHKESGSLIHWIEDMKLNKTMMMELQNDNEGRFDDETNLSSVEQVEYLRIEKHTAKEQLNRVFQLVNVQVIQDM